MALATIGDSWGNTESMITGLVGSSFGSIGGISMSVITARGTAKNLQYAGSNFDRQYLYIPMFMFLHDREVGSDIYELSTIEDMLGSAPCNGPYLIYEELMEQNGYQFSAHPSGGWASICRFRNGVDEQNGENFDSNGKQSGFEGFFNGLDYMLLYNLYHLLENPGPYVDLNNRNISDSYPQTLHSDKKYMKIFMGIPTNLGHTEYSSETGSVANPLIVNSLNTIESTAKLDNIDHHTEILIKSTTITTPLSPSWCTESASNTLHCAGCALIGWVNPSCWGEHYIELVNNSNTTDNGYKKSDVTLIAKNRIVLKPGFHAKKGSHFLAKIENNYCGTNMYKQTPYVTAYDSAYWNSSQIILYPEQEPLPPEPQQKQVKQKIEQNNIKIYPNPAKSEITIASTTELITNIVISNISGAIVLQQKANTSQQQINISNLQSGVYFVKVVTQTGNTFTQKLIKN